MNFALKLKYIKLLRLFHLMKKEKYNEQRQIELVKQSPLFDTKWYLAQNPDVKAKKMSAAKHYVKHGWKEGRNPSPNFDGNAYLQQFPELYAKGWSPLFHYMLEHKELMPKVTLGEVLANVLDEIKLKLANKFAKHGIKIKFLNKYEGKSKDYILIAKSKYFNKHWYLKQNPDVKKAKVDPIEHYLKYGWKEGKNPSKEFDGNTYLDANPDVRQANVNPLLHYLKYGKREGREVISITVNKNIKFLRGNFYITRFLREDKICNIKFSCILPTYNRAFCIENMIDSVLAQTYQNFELIIVDDGSKDNTEHLIKCKYKKQLQYGKIRYIKLKSNKGVCFARNQGLKVAKNEWICYVDSDNQIKDTFLESYCYFILSNPKVKTFYSQVYHINSKKIIGHLFNYEKLKLGNYIDMGTFVHSRDLYLKYGGFDANLTRMVDWDLILTYTKKYKPFFIPKAFVMYNDSNDIKRISNSENHDKNKEIIINKHYRKDNGINIYDNYKEVVIFGKTIFNFKSLDYYPNKKINTKKSLNINLFCKEQVINPTVLIIEPNTFHGEVVLGTAKYLFDLGYDIHVLTTHEIKDTKLFYGTGMFRNTKVFAMSRDELFNIDLKSIIDKYTYTFITSTSTYQYNRKNKLIPFSKYHQHLLNNNKVYFIEHDYENIKIFNYENLIKKNRIFMLTDIKKSELSPISFNPHYFSDNIKKIQKNEITNFAIVGNIQKHRRNYQSLIDAVTILSKKYNDRFRITVIGRGNIDNIPQNIQKYFIFTGFLSFPEMSEQLKKSSYLLALLDSSIHEHQRYLTSATSGTIQLMYGFLTPVIIEKIFADKYNISSNEGILYNKNGLVKGMDDAINMSQQQYLQCITNLENKQKNIYLTSLYNFQKFSSIHRAAKAIPNFETIYKSVPLSFSFNIEDKPRVSIIIPTYNHYMYTKTCLHYINKNSSNISYEIIVADDNSSDETQYISKIVRNVKHIRNNQNQGFLLNVNNAIKNARGQYIVLLNNDILVRENWLNFLLETFENEKNTGVVGGKVIWPNGRLQEVGCIFSTGSCINIGWNDVDPYKEKYNMLNKNIDYCSGCCLAFSKKDWDKVGGFDEQFFPAYFEETDFCFQVKHILKKDIICQPLCEVIHYHHLSYDKTSSSSLLETNKQKFITKWESVIK